MNAKQVYATLIKLINDTLVGAGALKGAPCEISKIEELDTGINVQFKWVDNTNTTHTETRLFPKGPKGDTGETGSSIVSASVKNKHLILTKDDGTEIDCGVLPTSDYDDTELRGLIADKVDKVTGKSLVYDTEIARLANVDNYDDTGVKNSIQTVANGLMASAGYSADYKTIDIVTVGGAKKSIDVKPAIEHANITELQDVDDSSKGNGKALVFNASTGKHEYAATSGTDELVKMDSSGDAKHLSDLIDKVTVVNENGTLKVKKLDGQEATIEEINYLKGLTMNVMDLVNLFANGGVKIIDTPVATYADLIVYDKSALIEGISYLIYVLADETHDGSKTTYLIDKDSSNPSYFGFADNHRDFTTNPINLVTEITGKLGTSNIDTDDLFALLSVDDTYKTETSTNNIFSTHGAKALYDELVQEIGLKANTSDLTTHTSDTSIHVSSTEKEKWNKVSEKAENSDLTSHTSNSDIHITADERTSWNGKIDKTSIATTIDNTCTDEQVPSAKAIYDIVPTDTHIKEISLLGEPVSDDKYGTDLLYFPCGVYIFESNAIANNFTNAPVKQAGTFYVTSIVPNKDMNTDEYVYRNYRYETYYGVIYTRSLMTGNISEGIRRDSGWNRVCTTKAQDVGVTSLASSILTDNATCNNFDYQVKNGICYVRVCMLYAKQVGNYTLLQSGSLPTPTMDNHMVYLHYWNDPTKGPICLEIRPDGTVWIRANTTENIPYSGTFSYPVAES